MKLYDPVSRYKSSQEIAATGQGAISAAATAGSDSSRLVAASSMGSEHSAPTSSFNGETSPAPGQVADSVFNSSMVVAVGSQFRGEDTLGFYMAMPIPENASQARGIVRGTERAWEGLDGKPTVPKIVGPC